MKQEAERKSRGQGGGGVLIAEKERKEKLQESKADYLDKVLPLKVDS